MSDSNVGAEHYPGPIHQPPVKGGPAGSLPDGHAHHPKLQHHFDNMAQQAEASTLGMWVFLSTEVLFFGGLFMAYLVYRSASPEAFQEGSAHLSIFWGTTNTVVLICSSLTMALAVRAAQTNAAAKTQVTFLIATMIMGLGFLGIKGIEYAEKFRDLIVPGPYFDPTKWEHPAGVEMFYSLYFCMTGLHAIHMIIGLGIMTVITVMAWKRQFNSSYYTPLEVAGLYWHFVDIVWIFLFPLLYLIGRHYHHG